MKVLIITQEDFVAIPRNISNLVAINEVEVVQIVLLNAKSSLNNRKLYFFKGFGVWQSFKMGLLLARSRVYSLLDIASGYRIWHGKHSVQSVAQALKIPFSVVDSPNEDSFIEQVRTLAPDLIVSYSAPCVFGATLLRIPSLGCINLHCSPLPNYAGVLPSFWTLYHGETTAGVTIHRMDSKIDNGEILSQEQLPVSHGWSMLQLIRETKRRGGDLMVSVIQSIGSGTLSPPPIDQNHGSYFSWPTINQMVEFRRRGGRLV